MDVGHHRNTGHPCSEWLCDTGEALCVNGCVTVQKLCQWLCDPADCPCPCSRWPRAGQWGPVPAPPHSRDSPVPGAFAPSCTKPGIPPEPLGPGGSSSAWELAGLCLGLQPLTPLTSLCTHTPHPCAPHTHTPVHTNPTVPPAGPAGKPRVPHNPGRCIPFVLFEGWVCSALKELHWHPENGKPQRGPSTSSRRVNLLSQPLVVSTGIYFNFYDHLNCNSTVLSSRICVRPGQSQCKGDSVVWPLVPN